MDINKTNQQILMEGLKKNPLYVPKDLAPAKKQVHQVMQNALSAVPSQVPAKSRVWADGSPARIAIGTIVGILIAGGFIAGGYFLGRSVLAGPPGDSLPNLVLTRGFGTICGVAFGVTIGAAIVGAEDDGFC